MVRRIVEERKLSMEGNNGVPQPKDAVDALLRDTDLSLELISGNIIEMMIPGEETLPTTMTLAVKYLSDCPLALHRLRVLFLYHSSKYPCREAQAARLVFVFACVSIERVIYKQS